MKKERKKEEKKAKKEEKEAKKEEKNENREVARLAEMVRDLAGKKDNDAKGENDRRYQNLQEEIRAMKAAEIEKEKEREKEREREEKERERERDGRKS